MQIVKILKPLSFLLFVGIFMVSCDKEPDDLKIEEKEEIIETVITIEINDRSVVTDAYAIYCSDNGAEGLSVSNREILLSEDLNTTDFEDGDFLFILADDGTVSYGLGGVRFDSSITGTPYDQIIFTTDLDIVVDSNDGSTVAGSMSGTLLALDDNFEPTIELPISITYNAEIVGSSSFCE